MRKDTIKTGRISLVRKNLRAQLIAIRDKADISLWCDLHILIISLDTVFAQIMMSLWYA